MRKNLAATDSLRFTARRETGIIHGELNSQIRKIQIYRLQENVVQVFQPARSRFGAGFVATKGFFAGPRAGWKTCATFLFLEVYTKPALSEVVMGKEAFLIAKDQRIKWSK